MTVGASKPIPARGRAGRRPRPRRPRSSTGSPAAGSTSSRSTRLRSTAPRPRPRSSSPTFANEVLAKAKIANPDLAVRDRRGRRDGQPADGPPRRWSCGPTWSPRWPRRSSRRWPIALQNDPRPALRADHQFRQHRRGRDPDPGPDRDGRELVDHHRLPLVPVQVAHLRPGGGPRRGPRRADHPGGGGRHATGSPRSPASASSCCSSRSRSTCR